MYECPQPEKGHTGADKGQHEVEGLFISGRICYNGYTKGKETFPICMKEDCNMKRRMLSALLTLTLCLGLLPAASAAQSVTVVLKLDCNQMVVNDTVQPVDDKNAAVTPIAENNRTLVPVSRIVAAFGGESSWDANTNATTFTWNGKTVKHTIGTNTVTTPKGEKTMEVASKAMNNRTYVPVRYVLEGLGLNVEYESTQQLVVVSSHALYAKGLLELPQAKALLAALGPDGTGAPNQTVGSAAGNRELVSAAVPAESKGIDGSSVAVQDMYSYMPKSMTFESINQKVEGRQSRVFQGGSNAQKLISGYVDALCATGNFRLVDSYEKSYKSTFFSYALDYTGTGRVSGEKLEMNFKNNVYGDVTIYGTVERSRCKGAIFITKGLEFDDLGLRSDGNAASTAPVGQSFSADLYRLADGSYETGDGRFNVAVGEAQVYRDGSFCITGATLLRNKDKNREELHIDDFYRNDEILFTAPYNSLLTGDVFDQRSIGVNTGVDGYEKYATSMSSFLSWKFSNKLVGVCHDGEYLYCYRDNTNGFADLSVRVMYWDTSREEAVIYLCARFDTAPYEYEALAAVRMKTVQATSSDSSGSSDSSSGVFDSDDSFNRPIRIRCTFIGCDGGKVRCSACDGAGGKRVYDSSTPQYDGVGSNTDKWDWETCYKCHGTGETDCTRCGGDGWIDGN